MAKQCKGILMTDRDKKFIKYLHAAKISTYERARRDIYPDYNSESVANRIRKMMKAGFVEGKRIHRYEGGKQLLNITKNGFKHYVKKEGIKRIELKSDSIKHDLTLVDLRHALLKSNIVSGFYTENQIQSWDSNDVYNLSYEFEFARCDGVASLDFGSNKFSVAFEYEHTQKTDIRYQRLVESYNLYHGIVIALFVAKSQSTINKIKKFDEQFTSSKTPTFMCALEDSILKEGKFIFTNYKGGTLDLNREKRY